MGISKGLKKKGGGTVSAVGKEQGKAVAKDEKVPKEKNEVEEQQESRSKPSQTKVMGKYSKNEIDEIFGNKKRKVLVAESSDKAGAPMEKKKVKAVGTAAMPVQASSNKASGGKHRKKTIDGFRLFSEDEIGWNKKNAGGTPFMSVRLQLLLLGLRGTCGNIAVQPEFSVSPREVFSCQTDSGF